MLIKLPFSQPLSLSLSAFSLSFSLCRFATPKINRHTPKFFRPTPPARRQQQPAAQQAPSQQLSRRGAAAATSRANERMPLKGSSERVRNGRGVSVPARCRRPDRQSTCTSAAQSLLLRRRRRRRLRRLRRLLLLRLRRLRSAAAAGEGLRACALPEARRGSAEHIHERSVDQSLLLLRRRLRRLTVNRQAELLAS
jgi:hypothetical protein